jgi:hypothetical protein
VVPGLEHVKVQADMRCVGRSLQNVLLPVAWMPQRIDRFHAPFYGRLTGSPAFDAPVEGLLRASRDDANRTFFEGLRL